MTTNDDERRKPTAGEQVGLGRVLRNHDAAAGPNPATHDVEEASSESFPASDPPAFAPGWPTRSESEPGEAGRAEPELPDPSDVP